MKAQRLVFFFLGFLVFGSALVGCNGAPAGSGSGGGGGSNDNGWGAQTRIESIFEANCSGCHEGQFSSCWNVQSSASEIEGAVSSGEMPESGKLAASDKAALLHWLRDGAECSGKRPEGTGGGVSIGSGEPPVGF